MRCLVYLKDHTGKVSVLGGIAKETRIPAAFLSKILQKLVKRGLVTSQKGNKGGFMLARDPGRISVYNIMQAVCGCETVIKVVCSKANTPCVFLKNCRIHGVWEDLGKVVRKNLDSRKLSRL